MAGSRGIFVGRFILSRTWHDARSQHSLAKFGEMFQIWVRQIVIGNPITILQNYSFFQSPWKFMEVHAPTKFRNFGLISC